ncbi:MAG: cupin domain-containing protein [Selenomonadaceae bacterium]|nr:cupin domain-containing protein [Selenomonadaceae bacterium]
MAIIEQKTVTAKNKAGGKGEIYITHLLTQNEMIGKCGMFAKVRIPVGASLGVHKHEGTTETYYLLQGTALYTDNDKTYEVKAGTTTFCADGDIHGIENIGDEDLIFMALIINTK